MFSFLMLLNSSAGKQHPHMRLGLQDKPNPGKWENERRLHRHGLVSVVLPDLPLTLHMTLHKTETSVICFANRLPRGYALSTVLVPSSPDVLDPVWNAHAKTLESSGLFIKAVLTWWSDGSHLLDGTTLLTSHKARGQSLEFLGRLFHSGVLSNKPRLVSVTVVPQRAPAVSGPSPGQTCFFL